MGVTIVLAFVSPEFISGALRVGVIGLGLGLVASLVLVPFLFLGGRLRSLFVAVGPADRWVGNYLLVMTIIGGGEIALFALTVDVIAVEYSDPAVVEQLTLYASVALLLGYIVVLGLIPFLLPRLGIDWDENGYDARTIGLVGGALLWYHAGTILLSPYAFDVFATLPSP